MAGENLISIDGIVSPRLHVEVALLPSLARGADDNVCIAIDVLRAGTSLAYMARTGVREVIVTPDPPAAREAARAIGSAALLGGESDGMKPEDFDLGNSPIAYADPSLAERPIVFCSSNGARALHLLLAAPVLMAGALVNAGAVARVALAAALDQGRGIIIVCAGEGHGTAVGLEDTFCAGLIVDHLKHLRSEGDLALDDSALLAFRLFDSYRPSVGSSIDRSTRGAEQMLRECEAAHVLKRLGYEDDVRACGAVDTIDAVMTVVVVDGQQVGRPVTVAPT